MLVCNFCFLGTSSLAVAFGSSIVSAFIIPVLIKRLGCRFVILFAEFGYLCFVICNIKSICKYQSIFFAFILLSSVGRMDQALDL